MQLVIWTGGAILSFLAICIAMIVWMELRHAGSRWAKALREWQSGLGALFGLASVALSLAGQAALQEYAKNSDALNTTRALAMDAVTVDNWLSELSLTLSRIENGMSGYGI